MVARLMARFVKFPGVAGSYADTPDVNLLTADEAHFIQGVGGWTVGAVSTEQSLFGPSSLKVLAGVSTALTPGTDAAFFSAFVFSVAGDDFDFNGDTATTVPAGVWTLVKTAGNATTYTLNAAGSADYYVDQAIVQAADVVFVPSLRIVGDLEMGGRFSVADWTATGVILSTRPSNNFGFDLFSFADNLASRYGNGTNERLHQEDAFPFVDGVVYDLSVEYDLNAVTYAFFIDGVPGVTAASVAGAGVPSPDASLFVGVAPNTVSTPLAGVIYHAEVRDGLGGPVVARFDAEDIPTI